MRRAQPFPLAASSQLLHKSRPRNPTLAWRESAKRWASTSHDNDAHDRTTSLPKFPFRFETGVALFAKRTPRPFPPPFLSLPSTSFSEPLSTFHRSRDRRPQVDGELIRGQTNGDDAVYASDYFICTNDGVGAWSSRPRGHAGLWSRLILHFWVTSMEEDILRQQLGGQPYHPDPMSYLERAFERTTEATSGPIGCHGTTTASGAQLYYKRTNSGKEDVAPLLYITHLGDCQVMVLRPEDGKVIFKTKEQWHWFDCPRQLGTNSPDTPSNNAAVDIMELQVGDIVLAMSDGVIDNLWEHEIVEAVLNGIRTWEKTDENHRKGAGVMVFAADYLMNAAKAIAQDPFAESPYMEHAIEEGLASEGGKLDDISVVAAQCVRNE